MLKVGLRRVNVKRIVEKSFEDAIPYIHNIEWLEKFINKNIKPLKNLESIILVIEEEMKRANEITKKTDLKIFLHYLKRNSQMEYLEV